jgi:translation initiation factor 4G
MAGYYPSAPMRPVMPQKPAGPVEFKKPTSRAIVIKDPRTGLEKTLEKPKVTAPPPIPESAITRNEPTKSETPASVQKPTLPTPNPSYSSPAVAVTSPVAPQKAAAEPVKETPVVPTTPVTKRSELPPKTPSSASKSIQIRDANGNIIDLKSLAAKKAALKTPKAEEPKPEVKPEPVPVAKKEEVLVEKKDQVPVAIPEKKVAEAVPVTPAESEKEDGEISASEEAGPTVQIPPELMPKVVNGKKVISRDFFMKMKEMSIDTASPKFIIPVEELYGEGDSGGRARSAPKPSGKTYSSRDERSYSSSQKGSGPRMSASGRSGSMQASGRGGAKPKGKREGSQYSSKPKLSAAELLGTSDNAWMPAFLQKSDTNTDEYEAKKNTLSKQIMAALNKLAPERFDILTDEISGYPIDDLNLLQILIDRIFDKALGEAYFGEVYARLCAKLHASLHLKHTWIPEVEKEGAVVGGLFRAFLLKKCRVEFESGAQWASEDEKARKALKDPKVPMEEKKAILLEQGKLLKAKIRTFGNIRFIGELFKLDILSRAIMISCIKQLLGIKDGEGAESIEPSEEQLEALCKLLTTIGKKLDQGETQPQIELFFARLEEFRTNASIDSRIKFAILDLIDLRKNHWVPRKGIATGPKTLEAARADSEKLAAAHLKSLKARPNVTRIEKRERPTSDGWTKAFGTKTEKTQAPVKAEPVLETGTKNMFGYAFFILFDFHNG